MNTKILSLFLFLLTSVAANASEWIKVSNREMSFTESWSKPSSYFNDTEKDGTVSWDATKRILTLQDFDVFRYNFSTLHGWSTLNCIIINSTKDVTIKVLGYNSLVTQCGQTLELHGNTTFTGDGTLSLWNCDSKKPCMDLCEENLQITVNGPKIKFLLRGMRGKNYTGTLLMKSGKMIGCKAPFLITMGSVIYDYGMGVQTPHGAYFSSSVGGFVDMNGNKIESEAIKLGEIEMHGFTINGVEITENNEDLLNEMSFLKSGRISYARSSNTLLLENATIENRTNYPTIENHGDHELTILLRGQNTFKYSGSKDVYDIRALANVTIESNEDVATLKSEGKNAGIFVAGGQKLTLKKNVKLDVSHVVGGSGGSEVLFGDNVEIVANGRSSGTVQNVNLVRAKSFIAVESTPDAPRFIWNRDDGSKPGVYQNRNSLATGTVKLSTMSDVKRYDLQICDNWVTQLNYSNPVCEKIKSGSISFAPNENRIYMTNLDMDLGSEVGLAVYWMSTQKVQIMLKGSNTINTNQGLFLKSNAQTEILSAVDTNQKLTVTGSNGYTWVGGSNSLVLNRIEASIPEISATNLTLVGTGRVDVTRKLSVTTCRLNNVKVASTVEAPAYYDAETQNVVAKNGPVSFVHSDRVTVYNGMYFMGEEVNSANASCLMNKHVKSGQISVSQKSTGLEIHLRDVYVNSSSSSHIFSFPYRDRVDMYVHGTNNFYIYERDAHFAKSNLANLWICGYGDGATLTVNSPYRSVSNAGAISVPESGSLYFTMNTTGKYSATLPRVYGDGYSSNLYVTDPYVTFTGNNKGTVSNISVYAENNAELYSTGSTPRTIVKDQASGKYGIYRYGDLCTEEVKFVAKGESYVPVSNINLSKTSINLTKKYQTENLKATILPSDATDKTLEWVSSDESVCTILNYGNESKMVSARGNGTATITVTASGNTTVKAVCQVTVNIPEPTGISFAESEIVFDRPSVHSIFLRATISPDNADTDGLTWESSDTTIVKVRRDSGIEARIDRVADDGEAIITVTTKNGHKATCKARIPVLTKSLEFDVPDVVHLTEIGQTLQITPIFIPSNVTNKKLMWYAPQTAVGTIDENGLFTAVDYGWTDVYAFTTDDSEVYKVIRVYVDAPPVLATGVEIEPRFPDTFYTLDERFLLTATVSPKNVANDTVRWESDDEKVATVDEHGLVTIVGWGSCHITATTTDGTNITSSPCYIDAVDPETIVEPVPATGIKLDVNEMTIQVGDSKTIGVTLEPANYNQSVMVEPMSEGEYWTIANVNGNYDMENNRFTIDISSDSWSGQAGTVKYRIRPSYTDMQQLEAMGIQEWELADTITIHVINPIIFTEASQEGIDVTYHVTNLDDNTCELYSEIDEMMMTLDPEIDEMAATPAVPLTATGKLTIPSRVQGYWVTGVKERAFQKCSGLTEIVFAEGITSIGDYACYRRLNSLQSVTLPSTLEELGMSCFAVNDGDYYNPDCQPFTKLREVNMKAYIPPMGTYGNPIENTNAFSNIAEDAVLYVPVGAKRLYSVYPWTDWFSRIKEKDFSIQEPEHDKGDVNGDDVVDVADIATVIDVMATGVFTQDADVNKDGTVDVADIATVIDIMAANARRLKQMAEE